MNPINQGPLEDSQMSYTCVNSFANVNQAIADKPRGTANVMHVSLNSMELPKDLLINIFRNLSLKEYNVIARVSRNWLLCSNSSHVWQTFTSHIPLALLYPQITLKENLKLYIQHKIKLVLDSQISHMFNFSKCNDLILRSNTPLLKKEDVIKTYLNSEPSCDALHKSFVDLIDLKNPHDIIKLESLLQVGLNVNSIVTSEKNQNDAWTPLFWATASCIYNSSKPIAVKKLLEYGANPALGKVHNLNFYEFAAECGRTPEEIEEFKCEANKYRSREKTKDLYGA